MSDSNEKSGRCPHCAEEANNVPWHLTACPKHPELDSHPDVFMGNAEINGVMLPRRMIRVAKITVDGTTCTTPLRDLVDTIDSGGKYEVEVTAMPLAAFNQLEEFAGW